MIKEKIPYFDVTDAHLNIKDELMDAITRVVDSGHYILGPEVEAFEQSFATYHDTKHCIAVNSGTSALHLGLMALGIQPGDEIITTPFTFAATAWGISYLNATPVFVDIDPETMNIDTRKIKEKITSKTKAIIPVHLFGHPCEMQELVSICDEFNLFLFEDAAQAHGAEYNNQKVGTFGHISAFSFFPTKNLGTLGEAGALLTDDDNLAATAKLLRSHGSKERYKYQSIGYNYRMEALHGAILNVKLKYLDQWNAERQKIASLYNELLADNPFIQLPSEKPNTKHAYHLYSIQAQQRSELINTLQAHNIGYSTHYPLPLHLQECYAHLNYSSGNFPISESISQKILNLPLFPGLHESQIERVAEVINNFYLK